MECVEFPLVRSFSIFLASDCAVLITELLNYFGATGNDFDFDFLE